jgi:serine/threonine protein kinase
MPLDREATFGDVGAGTRLGAYELLVPIAQGGMAVVWAARLRGSGGFQKLVAVKTIRRSLRFDARVERMFLSEAKLTARIAHPNVCAVRELGEESNCLFMAMEWVDGDTLAAIEEQKPEGLPVAVAARIGIDVGLGLAAVHSMKDERGRRLGLVHCDVSPQNVLVTLDGTIKVVDFGLVRASALRSVASDQELLGGKMSFMAPEQADGLVDARTDIFALGVVLYRLVTGRHPFEGATALERFRNMRRQNGAPPPPSALRPECPTALSRAIMRAIRRKPASRFHNMAAFVRALRSALPEVESAECRHELAAIARRTVGQSVLERRLTIRAAMQAADAARLSWPPPEPEPVSLPSSVLEELEPPPALQTIRPVSISSPSVRPRRREGAGFAGLIAAAVTLVGATVFTVSSMSASSVEAQPPAAAFGVATSAPVEMPRPAVARPMLAPPAAPSSSAKPVPAPAAKPVPAPTPSARPRPDWRFDPGF